MSDARVQRPRIAIVVQRFGEGITGGAEMHARLLVRHLAEHYEIDVLTSCARSYQTWERAFEPGVSIHGDHRVLRFAHPPRDRSHARRHLPLGAKLRGIVRRALPGGRWPRAARPSGAARRDGLVYLRAQGPACDGLLDHLRAHAADYRAVLCITALFFPTAMAVPLLGQRALLIPTLHDDPSMMLPHHQHVFRAPRAVLYNSQAELELAAQLYGDGLAPGIVCGLGVDLPPDDVAADADIEAQAEALLAGTAQYLLYAGRVDRAKGCAQLLADFIAWRAQHPTRAVKLVLCGGVDMAVPTHPDVIYAGFVARPLLDHLLRGASAMVLPSANESLSLITLEAMAAGCPVLVNGASPVLRAHVQASGTGACYTDAATFAQGVEAALALTPQERQAQAARARDYVATRYSWPHIIRTLRHAIDA